MLPSDIGCILVCRFLRIQVIFCPIFKIIIRGTVFIAFFDGVNKIHFFVVFIHQSIFSILRRNPDNMTGIRVRRISSRIADPVFCTILVGHHTGGRNKGICRIYKSIYGRKGLPVVYKQKRITEIFPEIFRHRVSPVYI